MITQKLQIEMEDADTRPIGRFLDLLDERAAEGWRHHLITTNWDYLLQREVDRRFVVVPRWLRDSQVFHFNGTVEARLDNSQRAPFVLEDDPPAVRAETFQTLEGRLGFDQLAVGHVIVVVGMSFECEPDKFLVKYLNRYPNRVNDKSNWIIVNPEEIVLAEVRGLILGKVPGATVECVSRKFKDWQAAQCLELQAKGVIRE
jgi:hypothetical protein